MHAMPPSKGSTRRRRARQSSSASLHKAHCARCQGPPHTPNGNKPDAPFWERCKYFAPRVRIVGTEQNPGGLVDMGSDPASHLERIGALKEMMVMARRCKNIGAQRRYQQLLRVERSAYKQTLQQQRAEQKVLAEDAARRAKEQAEEKEARIRTENTLKFKREMEAKRRKEQELLELGKVSDTLPPVPAFSPIKQSNGAIVIGGSVDVELPNILRRTSGAAAAQLAATAAASARTLGAVSAIPKQTADEKKQFHEDLDAMSQAAAAGRAVFFDALRSRPGCARVSGAEQELSLRTKTDTRFKANGNGSSGTVSIGISRYYDFLERTKLPPRPFEGMLDLSIDAQTHNAHGAMLTFDDLTPAFVPAAVDYISSLHRINELVLSHARLDEQRAVAILNAIGELVAPINVLDLSFNSIGCGGCTALANLQQVHGHVHGVLRELDVSSNALTDRAVGILCTGLAGTTVTKVNLSKNALQAEEGPAVQGLCKMLCSCPELVEIGLAWTGLHGRAAAAIITSLSKSSVLTADLSWNGLGTAHNSKSSTDVHGSVGVTKSAAKKGTQSQLHVPRTCATELGTLLRTNTTLTHLDLSFTRLCEQDCSALSTALSQNHSLLGLHMQGNWASSTDSMGHLVMRPPLPLAHRNDLPPEYRNDPPAALPSLGCGLREQQAHAVFHTHTSHQEPLQQYSLTPSDDTRADSCNTGCWICGRWRYVDFSCDLPESASVANAHNAAQIFLHLHIDQWQPSQMQLDDAAGGASTYRARRVLPPGRIFFCFSQDGKFLLAPDSHGYDFANPPTNPMDDLAGYTNRLNETHVLNVEPRADPMLAGVEIRKDICALVGVKKMQWSPQDSAIGDLNCVLDTEAEITAAFQSDWSDCLESHLMKVVMDDTERVKVQHLLRSDYVSLRQLFALYSAKGGNDESTLSVTWGGFERLCDDAGLLDTDGCNATVLQRIFIDTNVHAVPLEQHVLVRSTFLYALVMLALCLRRNMREVGYADEQMPPDLQPASHALGMLLSQHIMPCAQAHIRLDLRESLFVTENVSTILEKNAADLREVFMAFSDRRVAEEITLVISSGSTLSSNADPNMAEGDDESTAARKVENKGVHEHEGDVDDSNARATIAAMSLPRFLDVMRSTNACSRDDAVQTFSLSIKGHPAEGKYGAQQDQRVLTFMSFMEALLRVALALAKRGEKLKAVRKCADEKQYAASYDMSSITSSGLCLDLISPELQQHVMQVSNAKQLVGADSHREQAGSMSYMEGQSSAKSVNHTEVPAAVSVSADAGERAIEDHATAIFDATLPKSALVHEDSATDTLYAHEQGFAPAHFGSKSINLNALSSLEEVDGLISPRALERPVAQAKEFSEREEGLARIVAQRWSGFRGSRAVRATRHRLSRRRSTCDAADMASKTAAVLATGKPRRASDSLCLIPAGDGKGNRHALHMPNMEEGAKESSRCSALSVIETLRNAAYGKGSTKGQSSLDVKVKGGRRQSAATALSKPDVLALRNLRSLLIRVSSCRPKRHRDGGGKFGARRKMRSKKTR